MSNEFKPEGLQQIIDFADSMSSIKREGIPERLFDLCLHNPGVAKLLAIGARAALANQTVTLPAPGSRSTRADSGWHTGSSCTI